MSWFNRLVRRELKVPSPNEPDETEPALEATRKKHATRYSDPISRGMEVVAGLPQLGGEREQVRVTHTGTWSTPLYFTVTRIDDGAELSVIELGDGYREIVHGMLLGGEPRPCPTRVERRYQLSGHQVQPIAELLAGDSLWRMLEGELRGCDGHWVTVEVWSPARGGHSASDWCPGKDHTVGAAAGAIMRVVCQLEPVFAEQHWVQSLYR